MEAPDGLDLTAPDGTRIRLWKRAPADASAATEAVLFVHGATYGGRSAFDPEGVSWLAAVAETGRAAYAVDVRGYGDSERPPELADPPTANDPVVRAATAATDAETALLAIRETHGTVHLVGYSWGTMTAGLLLAERGVDVASLTQYAPVYAPPADRREEFSPGDPPAAYRTVTRAEARERWADQRPDGVPDSFDAFWDALTDSAQRVEGRGDHDGDEAVIAAPNGTLVDLQAATEAPLYDAADIAAPTLVVRGSLDTASRRSDALALYDALAGDERTYTEIAGGSHFMQLEAPRPALIGAVRRFQDRASGS
jgi:pimeloyl-ACP methyl ester carboxylesterase